MSLYHPPRGWGWSSRFLVLAWTSCGHCSHLRRKQGMEHLLPALRALWLCPSNKLIFLKNPNIKLSIICGYNYTCHLYTNMYRSRQESSNACYLLRLEKKPLWLFILYIFVLTYIKGTEKQRYCELGYYSLGLTLVIFLFYLRHCDKYTAHTYTDFY